MELNVLNGGVNTIQKFKPLILLEYFKSDENRLIEWLKQAGYKIYTGIGANYLCIPNGATLGVSGLPSID